MFAYYFQLGLRSLRRNPLLTALMVMAIGFGVAASMITYSVFRATANNPIPQKSDQLYAVQIANWKPEDLDKSEPPDALTYTDAVALMQAHRARRQTALYPVGPSVVPADASQLPFRETTYAWYGDAFAMFDIPFLYGGAWSAAEDGAHAPVAVLGKALNDKLFNGANSVGKTINLDGHDYRVTGVIDTWNPQPMFFDASNTQGFGDPAELFIPFTRAIDQQMGGAGNFNCSATPGSGWEARLRSECIWIAFWAELPSAAEAAGYKRFLRGYAAEQQHAGRFNWAPNVRLRNVTQWLDFEKVVPPESKISLLVSLGFLLICLVNTIGLLLAKFMRRAPEIGVRRALGASRKTIYAQFLVEAGAVGLAGGVLGLLLTGLGVLGVGLVFDPQIARLATLDFSLMGLTLLVATLATVLAAFYPTWRAAQVQPAWQLKSN
ncbi:ABC transporter permease [Frateuria terrea]|uniref:Putative ABC transport system permease protein n=1 Tax=Frateuria terrea TaxID=529704 RepID=A0A1H6R3D0_9GAMM|nr:ABC transporter permease [Frateuria terrea]SEI50408.1 putative ABC transport system permease protein [Frateuria terrea]SFP15499.1 putative ABC transport system permease protein [Frateuria terrea]